MILHRLFIIGIWFKGIDGVLEILGGTLLLFTARATLIRLVATLTQYEMAEDPTDWTANHLRNAVSHFSTNARLFCSVYLIGHGAIKVFLVWGGLLRRKLWAYPAALAFIGAFISYQVYRILDHFSIGLAFLSAIDLVVFLLIVREYRTLGLKAKSRSCLGGPARQTDRNGG